jgi:propionyl-CoA synthetase
VAFIYDSPVTQTIRKYTFRSKNRSSKTRWRDAILGLKKGDTLYLYAYDSTGAFAMLACARIGVTHSVVFGGFAPHELAIRIDDCKPRLIITASGIEVDKLIPISPSR